MENKDKHSNRRSEEQIQRSERYGDRDFSRSRRAIIVVAAVIASLAWLTASSATLA